MTINISVLIPVFNGEKTIKRAIDSILNQSFQAAEIIVCNDGSTDATHQICTAYDTQITYINQSPNLGLANTRNRLIDLARFEYLAWQDADDVSHIDRLKLQSKYLHENPDIVAVGSHLNVYVNDVYSHVRKYPLSSKNIKKNFLMYATLAQPTLMFRKCIFDKVGYYDGNFPPAEDYDMAERIIREHDVANIDASLVDYHLHGHNQTYINYKKMVLNSYVVKKRFINNMSACLWRKYALKIGVGLSVFFALILPRKLFIFLFNKLRVLLNYVK